MKKQTKSKTSVALVDATEAKNHFGEIIKRAYLQEEHLIVRRGGIPVVAIIPVQDYEKLVNSAEQATGSIDMAIESSARAAAARARLRDFLATAHKLMSENTNTESSDEAVEQEIDSAIEAVRHQVKRRQAKRRESNTTHI